MATTAVTPSVRTTRAEEPHDRVAGVRVELAGRLIGQEQLRPVGQCPRDGNSLLLAAGELVRPMRGARTQAHQVEELGDARVAGPWVGANEAQRDLDVLGGRQDRQQPEGLEDEGHRRAPEPDEIRLAHGADLVAVDHHASPTSAGPGRRAG